MQIFCDKSFKNPIKVITAFNDTEVESALDDVWQSSKQSYVIGYIRYETKEVFLGKKIQSRLPLLYFEVYDKYDIFKVKDTPFRPLSVVKDITYNQYKSALNIIKNEISKGNTYEVNYTYDCKVRTELNDFELYNTLLKEQKTQYNAFIQNEYESILSFSPELFFEIENRIITTKPMKGTIERGKNAKEDFEKTAFLKTDIKNRAENVMIVDLLRNDLSKIAETGSIRVPELFEIETHKTLHQMTSTITAKLTTNVNLYNIFKAIFPCGSITGAPKISTMEIIDKVEKGKRNVYCGAIGFLSPQKTVFSVPIRTLQKTSRSKSYTYRVGGAIVWDSEIHDEWVETETKTAFLNRSQNFSIIETIKIENLKAVYFKEHIRRMKKTAKFFNFIFPEKLKSLTPKKNGIMKIVLDKNGEYKIEYKRLNPSYTNKIIISQTPVNSSNIFLYHKTTIRDLYAKSFEKIKNNEIYDEIFYNEKEELTEGARTNLIIEKDGKLYTPKLSCGLLNGILRQKLLDKHKCTEKVLYKADLSKADKIYCINSVRGIVEVTL